MLQNTLVGIGSLVEHTGGGITVSECFLVLNDLNMQMLTKYGLLVSFSTANKCVVTKRTSCGVRDVP